MKKVLFLMLASVMVLSLCACGGGQTNEAPQTANESVQIELDLNAQNTLVIEGKECALPVSAKVFLGYGWTDAHKELGAEIEADKGFTVPSFAFAKNGETKISGAGFYNNTGKKTTLESCEITSLKLVGKTTESNLSSCSFTLPGGITEKSTYEDVLAAYGTKESATDYTVSDGYENRSEEHGFSVMYKSKDANVSPYNYNFAFNSDKTIKYVNVESINYTADSLEAFK